jgi:hypothetical protein
LIRPKTQRIEHLVDTRSRPPASPQDEIIAVVQTLELAALFRTSSATPSPLKLAGTVTIVDNRTADRRR